jgi:hypothetical protein
MAENLSTEGTKGTESEKEGFLVAEFIAAPVGAPPNDEVSEFQPLLTAQVRKSCI